jgi:serine/threonine protein kinase
MVPHDGSLIAQRFQPLEAIRPGFPIRARDLASAQTVVLHPVAHLDRRLVGIFHPSVVSIFDIVNHDGQWLAACEFVPSQSLEILLAGMLWHPRRAAEIVAEVADAAAELHARGLTHGHISTAAIFVTAKGKAKLSLIAADSGSDPQADVQALQRLVEKIGGKRSAIVEQTDSAAVLAAVLRTSKNPREEPS